MSTFWKVISIITICLIALPIIARFGYCWGWWLQANPWAYYWWLCGCGAKTEQNLYGDNVEVIVSACRDPDETALSPDGRYLIVGKHLQRESYLFDLGTGEEQPWPYPFGRLGDTEFWTNRLVKVPSPNQQKFRLVDVTDSTFLNFNILHMATIDGERVVDVQTMNALQHAERVIIFEALFTGVLLFDAEPKQKTANNYVLFFNKSGDKELIEAILSETNINYEKRRLQCFWTSTSCTSYDGCFVATDRTIFTAGDRIKVTEQPYTSLEWKARRLVGWVHDNNGVYLQLNPNSYIIEGGYVLPNLFRLPRPIVKLKVPDEYR